MITMNNINVYRNAVHELKHKLRLLSHKQPEFCQAIRRAVEEHRKAQKDQMLVGKFANIANALTLAKSDGEVNNILSGV